MNAFLSVALAFPLGCLALVCCLALLGIVMLAGALQGVGALKANVDQDGRRFRGDQRLDLNPLD
jgi:hypothetical protein